MSLPPRPMCICNICGAGFEFTRSGEDIQLKHNAPCEKCKALLADGYTAFISDNRFCFGKSAKLADMAGKIMPVTVDTMNALEGKFKIEKKFLPPNGNGKNEISE